MVNDDFFDQYVVLDPLDPTKGRGIFAIIGLADQATDPVRWFLNLRVGFGAVMAAMPAFAAVRDAALSIRGGPPVAHVPGTVLIDEPSKVRRNPVVTALRLYAQRNMATYCAR